MWSNIAKWHGWQGVEVGSGEWMIVALFVNNLPEHTKVNVL